MKVHPRLYSAIPRPLAASSSSAQVAAPVVRVRSNSACSSRSLYTAPQSSLPFAFFDAPPPPPPPSSRPGSTSYVISTRLAAEVKLEVENHTNSGQSNTPQAHSQQSGPPPYSLAFSSGSGQSSLNSNPSSHYHLFYPYTSFGAAPLNASVDCSSEAAHPSKRQRTRYHLDVGAYGIPKHARDARAAGRGGHMNKPFTTSPSLQEGSQAVQVGEDAYFIRENAMGIADGVGGWSKARGSVRGEGPSPSALFAHRLMHYCCEEVVTAKDPQSLHQKSPDDSEYTTLSKELDDTLEDLADGLDVLMVLERAYDKTLRAHVVPSPGAEQQASPIPFQNASPPPARATPSPQATAAQPAPASHPAAPLHADSARAPASHAPGSAPVPLREGSSTALLAILDHSAPASAKPRLPLPLLPRAAGRHAAPSPTAGGDRAGAVLRIAHLGDCMAMLIRDDEIVWRTDEMWWDFNTPVQLGPLSSTRPRDAQVFTVPVQADDIVVLASDGLSDNLWDEDILDEVLRFRRSFMSPSPSAPDAAGGANGAAGAAAPSALLRRSTLAGMLSEALCSRARCVSERKGQRRAAPHATADTAEEIPFGRRAREHGKWFDGGKPDDICVLVAVVSPSEPAP